MLWPVCSLASPGVPQGAKSIVDQKMEKKKKTETPTVSPWEAGAGCLAFQLTALSDHKSSETHCSLAAGRWLDSPGGISWAGLSWAARPFYKKAFFSLKKKSLRALGSLSCDRSVHSHPHSLSAPCGLHFAFAQTSGTQWTQRPRSVGGRVSEAFLHLLLRLSRLCWSWL